MIEVADDNWDTFDRRGGCCGPGTESAILPTTFLNPPSDGTSAPIFTYSESARERTSEMKNKNGHVRD